MKQLLLAVLTFLVFLCNGNGNGGENVAFSQDSKIQEGRNLGAVAADIDYGPYSADQWARMARIINTSDQAPVQGVVRGYLDEFEVSTIGTTVNVPRGAGWCNGHFLIGNGTPDWAVNITPPTAGHTRCDYVVMLENNTVGVYAPGAATMQTPNSADYGGIANQVPEFSCRLAIIKGAEDAACPPAIFTQTTALFMVPLASIEWDVAQAIDTVTDLRHYIHEYAVDILVPVVNGLNVTDGTLLLPTQFFPFDMLDEKACSVQGVWRVPADYVEGRTLTIGPVMVSAGVGNVYASDSMRSGQVGQSSNLNNYDIAIAAYALDTLVNEPFTHVITDAEIGDYFRMQFFRDATDPLDTVGSDVFLYGWRVQYTAAIPWD